MKSWLVVSLLLFPLMLTHCGVKHRIQKNQTYFDTLSPTQQELIEKGKIKEGFLPKMVAMAWGIPSDKIKSKKGKRGEREVWAYFRYRYEREPRRYGVYYIYQRREALMLLRYVLFEKGQVVEFGRPLSTFYSRYGHVTPYRCARISLHSSEGCALLDEILTPHFRTLRRVWY